MRYEQLDALIDETRPRTIVEVGVARGDRAKAMVLRALRHRRDVHYTGHDVFETRDAAFHAAAFNMKKVAARSEIEAMLAAVRLDHSGFGFDLVVGDTRDTLRGRTVKADFVFIDGDHRVEAIEMDYAALRSSRVVVLDDYYVADEHGCPDTRLVGCNRLVDSMGSAATLLPMADRVRGGGLVKMALVR